MEESDHSWSLKSVVWLRARINSLNLVENSWSRNREICVGCGGERETLEQFMLHYRRWEEWRLESRALHKYRIEESDQVLGEFLFVRHEKKNTTRCGMNDRGYSETAKRTPEREEKSNSRRIEIRTVFIYFNDVKKGPFCIQCILGCRIRIWNLFLAVASNFWVMKVMY